jgi:murein DD-endopeptidase MepM/ murein hydrolase activator NlpD
MPVLGAGGRARLARPCRRISAAASVLVATVVAISLVLSGGAQADTASDLAAARDRVAAAQAEANEAAGAVTRAQARYNELDAEIDRLETIIESSRQRAAVLEDVVRARALRAYTQRDTSDLDVMLSADNPLEAARRQTLLDLANQTDRQVVGQLAALRADLGEQQHEVEQQREEQRRVKENLDARYASVRSALAEASTARDALAAKLEKEQADAAAAAELARLRTIQASTRAAASNPGASAPSAGQIIANPGGGSFQCPVSGAAYSNNYGARGSGFHYGIDLMAPTGTPLVAVKAGSVSFVANAGAGGNEVYLSANDGNVYYYAHLSQFAGGSRSVSQGEVIGLVGSTGRSSAPHLHFEIRIGGANGQRINPYATLQSAGC